MLTRQVNYKNEVIEALELNGTDSEVVRLANLRIANFLLTVPAERRTFLLANLRGLVEAEADEKQDNGDFNETISAETYFCRLLTGVRVSIHSDGSVDGPEIVTKNHGETTVEFMKVFSALLEAVNEVEVDAGCSFHIHLSVKDWEKHGYDANLQRLMLKFLMDRVHMWPAEVVHRCAYVWGHKQNTYFVPTIDGDKYRAVAFRSHTWEFRLWGGLSNKVSARRAMCLSVAAYNWARKMVSEGKESSLLNHFDRDYSVQACTIRVCTEATTKEIDWSRREFNTCSSSDMEADLRRVIGG
jgi:hypothetical protein